MSIPDVEIPDVPEAEKVRGWKGMGLELRVDAKTAKGYADRPDEDHPLPVYEDHRGWWTPRSVILAWENEEKRRYRRPSGASPRPSRGPRRPSAAA